MGCGASRPATKDAPIEERHTNGTAIASSNSGPAAINTAEHQPEHTSVKPAALNISSLVPIEFGLVKGLEYGDKTAPALLVVQVSGTSSELQLFTSNSPRTSDPQSKLVQEWWGINDDIKEKAMMLHAKGGCRVFIPDIYKGKSTVEVAEAKHVSPAPQVCCDRCVKWCSLCILYVHWSLECCSAASTNGWSTSDLSSLRC